MKKIISIIKKIIFSVLIIYGFNMLYSTIKINIPINIYTLSLISLLGLPGLCSIIFIAIYLY